MPLKIEIPPDSEPLYTREMTDITSQYFKKELSLHFFGHITAYPNGKFSCLCTPHPQPKTKLSEEHRRPIGFTFYDHITDKVVFSNLDKGKTPNWQNGITHEAKKRFSILNPMIITKKYDDHYEIFIFDLHKENAYDIYLNHFALFENFIHYYKEKSKKIRLKFNHAPLKILSPFLPTKPVVIVRALNTPTLKKYYLRYKDKDIVISAKEYYCLSLLAHGKQLKMIAKIVGISLRTVETYLERIKRKFNLLNRDDLITLYWKNKILSV